MAPVYDIRGSPGKILLALLILTSFIRTGQAENFGGNSTECPDFSETNLATDDPKPWKAGKSVTFMCTAGTYLIKGSLEMECNEDGIWNETTPACDYPCPRSDYDVNTMKMITQVKAGQGIPWLPGDIVQYECLPGTVVTSGTLVVQCQKTYEWNATLAQCKAQCPDFNNASLILTPPRPWTPGQSYRFKCKDGSDLVGGSLNLMCTMDSKWNATTPVCKAQCPEFNNVSLITPRGPWTPGQSYRFKCKDGSDLVGGSLDLMCTMDSKWNATTPVCKAPCPKLDDNHLILKDGSPKSPHRPGDVVSYKCGGDNLVTNGSLNLKCMDNSKWNGTLATCKAPCRPLTEDNLVRLTPTKPQPWPQGTEVAYKCASGTCLKQGSLFLSCGTEGEWNTTVAVCAGTCPLIQLGANMKFSKPASPPWWPGTELNLQCTNGAKLETGSLKLRCVGERRLSSSNWARPKWDKGIPKCSVPCPEISGTNAKVNGSGPWFPGMSAELTCPKGKVPTNGSLSLMCTENSQWDVEPAKCIANCPSFKFNGTIEEGSKYGPWLPGNAVVLKCPRGATFQTGSLILTCQAKSENQSVWDYPPPVCYTSFFEYHSGYDDVSMLFHASHQDQFKWRKYSFMDNTCTMRQYAKGSSLDAWPVNLTAVPDWPKSVAWFQTREIITPPSGDIWIRFYYKVTHKEIGKLRVDRIDMNGTIFNAEILKPHNIVYNDQDWILYSYKMRSSVFNGSKLHFEATVEAKIMTAFRIDDIVVADGPWMFPEIKDICPHIWDTTDYVANGYVQYGNCQGREGSRVYFKCNKTRGYKFEGTASGSKKTHCIRTKSGRTGEWIPNNGVCVLAKCTSPPEVPNAIIGNITQNPNVAESTDLDMHHAFSIAEYQCDENSTYISGPKWKRCGLNDKWSTGDIKCSQSLPTPTPTESTTERSTTTRQSNPEKTTSTPVTSETSSPIKTATFTSTKRTLTETQTTKPENENPIQREPTPNEKVATYEKRKLYPILPVGEISSSSHARPQLTIIICISIIIIQAF